MSKFCSLVPDNFLSTVSIIKELGEGTYGKVVLAKTRDDLHYAIKFQKSLLGWSSGIDQPSLIEIDTLVRLRGTPHIVYLIGACLNPSNEVALILEPLSGTLFEALQAWPYPVRVKLFPQLFNDLISATAVLERMNINHYDVKPLNVLVEIRAWTGEVPDVDFKLSDFGISRLALFTTNTQIVTPLYRPPELLAGRPRWTFHPSKIDIWSLGVTFAEFLLGEGLFRGEDDVAMLGEIQRFTLNEVRPNFLERIVDGTITGNYQIEKKINLKVIPKAYGDVLKAMLALNPNDRPPANQIVDYLRLNIELPPIPVEGRRYSSQYVMEMIRQCGRGDTPASILIGVEILSRYSAYTTWTHSAAAYYLGSTYIADQPHSIEYCADKFRIDADDTIQAQKEILQNVGFRVYNARLTPRLSYLYRTYSTDDNIRGYLQSLPESEFAKPIEQWFEPEDVVTAMSNLSL
jgi:serine/threonine protein kinase